MHLFWRRSGRSGDIPRPERASGTPPSERASDILRDESSTAPDTLLDAAPDAAPDAIWDATDAPSIVVNALAFAIIRLTSFKRICL